MLVIPAMDILKGKVVRLYKGDYSKVKEYGKPIEILKEKIFPFWKRFATPIKRLHLVDLEGARTGKPTVIEILKTIKASHPEIEIEVGGGIRSIESAIELLESGADYLVIGTALLDEGFVKSLLQRVSPEKIIASADTRDGKIAVRGWLETADLGPEEFIENMLEKGIKQFLVTSISKDGTLEGPDVELYRQLKSEFREKIYLIASGGVSSKENIEEIKRSNCADAVIVGKALYEGLV